MRPGTPTTTLFSEVGGENRSIAVFEVAYSWAHVYIVTVSLGFLILCIIGGNALVMLAVLTERHLRVVPNFLILSLAMADLLVAVVVMPLSVVHEISRVWWLGLPLCDLWICADVLLCTVSTLHLCAISIERCLAVSSLTYMRHRSASFVLIMVGICWVLATMVSLPARFHGHRQHVIPSVIYDGICEINMEIGYTIISNLMAFDLPMVFIVLMYARIYCAARKHIRKRNFNKYQASNSIITNQDNMYAQHLVKEKTENRRYCCYCCGYVMETKFHKGRSLLKVGLTRCSELQCSSSLEKRTTVSDPPETVVAAAVTAMKMAATMISTTKEPEWGQFELDSSDGEGGYNLPVMGTLKNKHFDEASLGSDDDKIRARPLTYDTIRNLQKLREARQPCDSLSGVSVIPRDASIYTNHSSILFADENSLSSSLYSSKIQHSDSKDPSTSTSPQDDQSSHHHRGKKRRNFVPLVIYYRRQRQQRWLAQGRVINKKAMEMMKNLSMDESEPSFRPQEDRYIRERIEQKRERRTVRTLAIITGCFVLCWLPFNIHASLSPFFGRIHPIGASVLLWLGYLNSLLNPIIYTLFSKEFRSAFRRIICRGPRLNCFR